MKKDRNCGCNYPNYQNFPMQNMMPGIPTMPDMMPYNMNMGMNYGQTNYNSNNIEQQIALLNSQLGSLERRVNNLENIIGNNKYNNSNYQML